MHALNMQLIQAHSRYSYKLYMCCALYIFNIYIYILVMAVLKIALAFNELLLCGRWTSARWRPNAHAHTHILHGARRAQGHLESSERSPTNLSFRAKCANNELACIGCRLSTEVGASEALFSAMCDARLMHIYCYCNFFFSFSAIFKFW